MAGHRELFQRLDPGTRMRGLRPRRHHVADAPRLRVRGALGSIARVCRRRARLFSSWFA